VAARRAELERLYLMPAAAHLERSRGADQAGVGLVEALLAYQRGERVRALALAREAARRTPVLYEAHVLQATILHEWALIAADSATRDALFAAAIAAMETAARVGQSDVTIYQALAESWLRRLELGNNFDLGSRPASLFSMIHAADRAIAASPTRAIGHRRKATAYVQGAYWAGDLTGHRSRGSTRVAR